MSMAFFGAVAAASVAFKEVFKAKYNGASGLHGQIELDHNAMVAIINALDPVKVLALVSDAKPEWSISVDDAPAAAEEADEKAHEENKGYGKVQRAVLAELQANPGAIYSLAGLANAIYRLDIPTKNQLDGVRRALKRFPEFKVEGRTRWRGAL
jgi:hypothetical protein